VQIAKALIEPIDYFLECGISELIRWGARKSCERLPLLKSITSLTIPIEKLITWNDETAQKFHDFGHATPTIFWLSSDIRSSETIAGTLQHIVYLELRFANLIAGLGKTPLEDIPKHGRLDATMRSWPLSSVKPASNPAGPWTIFSRKHTQPSY
jgi:hypothetical protein